MSLSDEYRKLQKDAGGYLKDAVEAAADRDRLRAELAATQKALSESEAARERYATHKFELAELTELVHKTEATAKATGLEYEARVVELEGALRGLKATVEQYEVGVDVAMELARAETALARAPSTPPPAPGATTMPRGRDTSPAAFDTERGDTALLRAEHAPAPVCTCCIARGFTPEAGDHAPTCPRAGKGEAK